MITENIVVVKRVERQFSRELELDPTDDHHQKIINHINILNSVNIDYWETRDKIIRLAKNNIIHAGFQYIIENLQEFEENIHNLKNKWVYFTDDDDWVDNNIISVLSEVIRNNDTLEAITWPHIRYHSMFNTITGNPNIDPNYNPTPKLQTNHSIIKITERFINEWKPELNIKDKSQHWNLSEYLYNNDTHFNMVEIPRYLSLWNNTPISFSWCMHPEIFSTENKDSLYARIVNFSTLLPHNTNKLIHNNPNTVFLNYIHTQQRIFKRYK